MNQQQANTFYLEQTKRYLEQRLGLQEVECSDTLTQSASSAWTNMSAKLVAGKNQSPAKAMRTLCKTIKNSVKAGSAIPPQHMRGKDSTEADALPLPPPKEVYTYADGSLTVVYGNLHTNVRIEAISQKASAAQIVTPLPVTAAPTVVKMHPRRASIQRAI